MRKNQVVVLTIKAKPITFVQTSVEMSSKNLPRNFSSDGEKRDNLKARSPRNIVPGAFFVWQPFVLPYRPFSVQHLFRKAKSLEELYAPVKGVKNEQDERRKKEPLIEPHRLR